MDKGFFFFFFWKKGYMDTVEQNLLSTFNFAF
jgi:hypothetical protein